MASWWLQAVTCAAWLGHALGCTVMAVGRAASASGNPMVTHTDDSGPTTTDVRLVRVPRQQWGPESRRPIYLWQIPYPRVVSMLSSPSYAPRGHQQESYALTDIPQVSETWAYWDTDYGVQNEWGLSIGESTATANTVGWPATPDKPYGYCKIGIDEMSKVALERCKTARCAVQLMGDLAVSLGFFSADSGTPDQPSYDGSSEALVVADADPGDVWVFNVLTGPGNASAIWAAQRIPPDHVVAVGNSFTIRRLNLSDPENNLFSPGVTKLAEEKGWWHPEEAESPDLFDFFSAYGFQPPPGGLPWMSPQIDRIISFYSGRRMWRIFSLLSPEEGGKLDPNRGNLPKTQDPYPVSVPAPKGSVTLTMVMNVQRDHYEGTPYDLTEGMAAGPFGNPNRGKVPKGVPGQWERAISMFRSSFSFVAEPRTGGLSLLWWGYDAPHGTAYLPFYGAATTDAPASYQSPEVLQSKFSPNCAWWAFNLVNQYTDLDFRLINAEVRRKAAKVEEEAFSRVKEWEQGVQEASTLQLEELTKRSNEFASAKVAEWWSFAWSLFAKYGRYVETFSESEEHGENVTAQEYPEWWLRSADVGFSSWQPEGPYHGIPDELTSSPFTAGSATHTVVALGFTLTVVLAAAVGYFVGLLHARKTTAAREVDVYYAYL